MTFHISDFDLLGIKMKLLFVVLLGLPGLISETKEVRLMLLQAHCM